MLDAQLHDFDGEISDHTVVENFGIVQNSDNGFVTSFCFRILISIIRSLLLVFALGS